MTKKKRYKRYSPDGRFFGLISEKELVGRALGVYYRRQEGFVWKPL